jgi:hypothetical protein
VREYHERLRRKRAEVEGEVKELEGALDACIKS